MRFVCPSCASLCRSVCGLPCPVITVTSLVRPTSAQIARRAAQLHPHPAPPSPAPSPPLPLFTSLAARDRSASAPPPCTASAVAAQMTSSGDSPVVGSSIAGSDSTSVKSVPALSTDSFAPPVCAAASSPNAFTMPSVLHEAAAVAIAASPPAAPSALAPHPSPPAPEKAGTEPSPLDSALPPLFDAKPPCSVPAFPGDSGTSGTVGAAAGYAPSTRQSGSAGGTGHARAGAGEGELTAEELRQLTLETSVSGKRGLGTRSLRARSLSCRMPVLYFGGNTTAFTLDASMRGFISIFPLPPPYLQELC